MDSKGKEAVVYDLVVDTKKIKRRIREGKAFYQSSLEPLFEKERTNTERNMAYSNGNYTSNTNINLAGNIIKYGLDYLHEKFGFVVSKIDSKVNYNFEEYDIPIVTLEEGINSKNDVITNIVAFHNGVLFAAGFGLDEYRKEFNEDKEHEIKLIGRNCFINNMKDKILKSALEIDIVNDHDLTDSFGPIKSNCLNYDFLYNRKGNELKITFK